VVTSIIPAIVREEPEGRTARIARDSDGEPIGVALFFTPEEIESLGVNTDIADAVELQMRDDEVQFLPISWKRDE
jgi:hypothetical protein